MVDVYGRSIINIHKHKTLLSNNYPVNVFLVEYCFFSELMEH